MLKNVCITIICIICLLSILPLFLTKEKDDHDYSMEQTDIQIKYTDKFLSANKKFMKFYSEKDLDSMNKYKNLMDSLHERSMNLRDSIEIVKNINK